MNAPRFEASTPAALTHSVATSLDRTSVFAHLVLPETQNRAAG